MSQANSNRPPPRRSSVALEEDKAWIGFYRRTGDPAIAAEILQQLEADAEMKRAHLALYLRCRESLRRHKERQARNKRIGQFVRMLCGALLLTPVHAVGKWLREGGNIAVACLPDAATEPAKRHVRRLAAESEFVHAQSAFSAEVTTPTDPPSSGAKTA